MKTSRTNRLTVSLLRWTSALGLAILALVVAVASMRTYLAHEMTLGVWAVLATAVLLLLGLGSLGAARLRLGRELVALEGASPIPVGQLWRARAARLAEIQAAGAHPRAEVLAEVTRAEEAGRAYLGRYLVATTVLIGLVGTFAGLMQTLGKLTPLLGDARVTGADLLAAPLAGLHVTFGASLVAILATLALALAQGDLALCEERALARLEDRTTHEWIPALWRTTEGAEERMVRAVDGLRGALGDSLAGAVEASVRGMTAMLRADGERARSEHERAARGLEVVAATVKEEIARLCVEVAGQLTGAAERQVRTLTELGAVQATSLAATTDAVAERMRASSQAGAAELRAEIASAWTEATGAHQTILRALAEEGAAALARSAGVQAAVNERASAAVEATSRETGRALAELGRASARAIDEVTARASGAVEESARRSAETSATLLHETSAQVAEAARETALLVARSLEPLLAAEARDRVAIEGALREAALGAGEASGRLTALTASLESVGRDHAAAIERGGQAVLAAFEHAVLGGGAALDRAAAGLAAAARDLQSGAELLTPRLAALSTELGALAREVALLMAARGPDDELGAAVLDELERLGGAMESLGALVRAAHGTGPTEGPRATRGLDAPASTEPPAPTASPAPTAAPPPEPASASPTAPTGTSIPAVHEPVDEAAPEPFEATLGDRPPPTTS
jgi:hypothetical protein